MTRQLTLTFDTPRRLGLAEFAVGEANRAAVEAIGRWPHWPSPVMLVVGEAASGKSHLAAILAAASAAPIFAADAVDWHALAAAHAGETLIVEDLGEGIDEAGLFHLINAVTADGGRLMLTSRTAPAEWRLSLPDLASRRRAATPVTIGAPDDRLMEQLLGKLFVDRQTTGDPQVIRFIAQRSRPGNFSRVIKRDARRSSLVGQVRGLRLAGDRQSTKLRNDSIHDSWFRQTDHPHRKCANL